MLTGNVVSITRKNEQKNINILEETRKKLDYFLIKQLEDLEDEGAMCLELCEEENDFHMTTYWVSGTYDEAAEFLTAIKDKKELNLMMYVIKQKYPNDIEKLKEKVKWRGYNQLGLTLEMLATLMLKDYQTSDIWCSIYGCTQEDMADFNKNHVLNALYTQEEFPVMQIEDIVGTMFEEDTGYGVRNTVQPSDLYDVFAYNVEELKLNKQVKVKEEYVFTPDTFEYEGVVYRSKKYIDLKKDIKAKGVNLFSYMEMQMQGISNVEIIRQKYLYEFDDLKMNLFTEKNFLVNKISENQMRIVFIIDGIENKKKISKEIYNKIFEIPEDIQGVQDFVINLAEDIKVTLAGKEKERNKEVYAVGGLYPRKNLATHGLQLIKNLAPKDRSTPRYTNITAKLAEAQSLYIIKKSLRLSGNMALSCSFGVDSILALYLTRKVKKNAYDIVFNNSRMEYDETIQFKNKIIKEWDLKNIIETLPVKDFWKLKEENGWNWQDKGDRNVNNINGKKASASEQCCYYIKHLPMYNLISEKGYDADISGLRADESRQRVNAGKRDGVFYFAKTWDLFKVNPLLFWTNEMVWEYVQDENIPYSGIYDQKLYNEKDDEIIYEPRTGCWACMLNAKRNYLRWLKHYKREKYDFLMFNKGMAKDLYAMGMNYQIKKADTTQVSMFDTVNTEEKESFVLREEDITQERLEYYESLIDRRPCLFLK